MVTGLRAWRVVSSPIPLLAPIISTRIMKTFSRHGEHHPAIRTWISVCIRSRKLFGMTESWDAFICHASEYKEDFVQPLAGGGWVLLEERALPSPAGFAERRMVSGGTRGEDALGDCVGPNCARALTPA